MNYKELNVYQRAYKMAIELHLYLDAKKAPISSQNEEGLRYLSREITNDIANGATAWTPKARRFMNFRALDGIRRIMMDLEFLSDIHSIPAEDYQHFYSEYEVCAKQLFKLNRSILEKSAKPKEEAAAVTA
jgi:hypothetical protein